MALSFFRIFYMVYNESNLKVYIRCSIRVKTIYIFERMIYMNVKRIIELNNGYTYKFDGEVCHGYGNIRFFYGHIYAYKEEVYKIWVYNTNEYGRIYWPHRDYIYTCQRDGIYMTYPDGDTIKIKDMEELSVPYGWDTAKKEKLIEVLESLK